MRWSSPTFARCSMAQLACIRHVEFLRCRLAPVLATLIAVEEEHNMTADELTLLERRKIEAKVLIPMVQAFQRAIGKERANEIAREAILEFARASGAGWAGQFGNDLAGLEEVVDVWAAGGSLEFADRKRSSDSLSFNVTRCRYAEFFQSLGLAELGFLFHCNRDFAVLETFSPDVSLTRTQTIMQGATHCDFRFEQRT
jgi:hypothetical protein